MLIEKNFGDERKQEKNARHSTLGKCRFLSPFFFFSFLNVSPIGKGLLKRSSTLNCIEMSFTFTAFSSKDAVTRDKVLRMTPEEILYLSIFKY